MSTDKGTGMSNKAKIREEAKKLNPIDDLMFRTMAEDKDFCEETEEGQQVMCEIMEKLVEENTDRINTLNSILIDLNMLDDLKRATKDKDFQMRLMIELLPENL